MELHKIIIIASVLSVLALFIGFIIVYFRNSIKAINNTQRKISDKALIEFIDGQPDKIVNAKLLREEFALTKFEAGSRLRHLLNNGIVQILRTAGGLSSYYTLSKPIDKKHDLDLTDDPFMTVEDLMLILKHNDFQVTLQEICLATGLPIKIILEEMKYFEKEKVVKRLLMTNSTGFGYRRIYTLQEPYRSNPEEYLALKDANFELKEIYQRIQSTD